MTFEELWRLVDELNILPKQTIELVPHSLSDRTKKQLCMKKPEEVTEIVQWAIRQIDHGSIETVDALVNQRL